MVFVFRLLVAAVFVAGLSAVAVLAALLVAG